MILVTVTILPKFTIQYAGGYNGIMYALKFTVYNSNSAYGITSLYIRRDI